MSTASPVKNSELLPELLNGCCHVEEVNEQANLVYYAKSDFTAADSNQVFTLLSQKESCYIVWYFSCHWSTGSVWMYCNRRTLIGGGLSFVVPVVMCLVAIFPLHPQNHNGRMTSTLAVTAT